MRDYLRVSSWGYPYGIVVLDVLALGLDCLASLCRLASMFCLGGIFSVMGTVSGHADLPSPRGRFSAGVDRFSDDFVAHEIFSGHKCGVLKRLYTAPDSEPQHL